MIKIGGIMKKTAELFTPQETESHLWQKKQRALKHLKVLLLVPLKVNDKMPNVRLIKDQLRYLVKEVLVIKYQHKLDEYINRFQPDLILALGSETVFPEENLAALRTSTVPKAIWMADAAGLSIIERKLAFGETAVIQKRCISRRISSFGHSNIVFNSNNPCCI